MNKFLKVTLSTLLLVNLVGCNTNETETTVSNNEVKVEEKTPYEVPKQETPKQEEPKQEEQQPQFECDWITKQDFIEGMEGMMDDYGIQYQYMELTDVNNDPMFQINEHVGICGYVDENDNITKITVVAVDSPEYEDYQIAGQLYGIAISIFTEDAQYIDTILSIFDETYGIYDTGNFIYEYQEIDGEVVITIYPSNTNENMYQYHIDENGDEYITKGETI